MENGKIKMKNYGVAKGDLYLIVPSIAMSGTSKFFILIFPFSIKPVSKPL